MDYVDKALRYMNRVLTGKLAVCREVVQACERQQKDLIRKRFPYIFDRAKANRVCKFIELLKHAKGPLAGENIHLEDWQCFILTTIFGWVHRKTGYRRFSRAYAEIPRGNGKSAMSSGVALYMLCADGEQGADIYSFATTRQQARIVFDDAKAMARQSMADLQSAFGMEILANSILIPRTNSKFLPRSSQSGPNEGLNTHFACVDELHAHKTRELYDVVLKSLGKRAQGLFWSITTAGNNVEGICYEVRRTVKRILDGTVKGERQFGIIYTIDPDDDWRTEDALRKANPNYGISLNPADLLEDLNNALVNPSAENDYKTKRLDVWCNSQDAWLDMVRYRKCSRKVTLTDFVGCPCIYGLDLAAKIDIAALVRLFWRMEDGVFHYYVFPEFFLPQDTIRASGNSQYSGWVKTGLITEFPGPVIDLTAIQQYILSDLENFEILACAYDPWQASQLAQNLMAEGVPMVELGATVKNFSEPMKQVQSLIYEGRLHTDGNEVLEWMASNVVCHFDAKENIYPRKERPEDKIDGMVALIMAMNQAVFLNVEENYGETSQSEPLDWSCFSLDV